MANFWALQTYCFVFLAFFVRPFECQRGFISLDCGGSGNFTDSAGIEWVSDDRYIKVGTKVSFLSDGDTAVPRQETSLRKFTERSKNCYELSPVEIGSRYLIRATFVYGNYDGLNSPPTFILLLDSSVWDTISFKSSSGAVINTVVKDMVFVAKLNPTCVCLAQSSDDTGFPVISSLELRPLRWDMYWPADDRLLLRLERTNFGLSTLAGPIRYPDDPFDRLWNVGEEEFSFPAISTESNVSTGRASNRPPSKVMQTAIVSKETSPSTLALPARKSQRYGNLYFALYFAEIEVLNETDVREFDLYLDNNKLYGPIRPVYLQAFNVTVLKSYGISDSMQLSLRQTDRSSKGPLVNALEIYRQGQTYQNGTFASDVQALSTVQRDLHFEYLFGGDPCLPAPFSWDWVICSNDSIPRIIGLKLSKKGLSGTIPLSIANLKALEVLDLSDNNLKGNIPEFLVDLKNLRELNLENNKLNGSVSATLLNKAGLSLRLAGNSVKCKKAEAGCISSKSNKRVVLASTSAGVVTLCLTLFAISFALYRKRAKAKNKDTTAVPLKKFSYTQVRKMTNGFSNQVGRGGFGRVYHGRLSNGEQVAVKVLSENSKQGVKEFKAEISMLARLHHKNLVSLVGYCCKASERILIYEYMDYGSLHNLLQRDSDAEHLLDWETRLGIALSTAQGLEYLHNGCRPNIIHRDIKTANILINDRMEAKISDFGLSRDGPATNETHVTTDVKGTFGYLDPQYMKARTLREKSDVYSFGVVLFEIISGRPVLDPAIESNENAYVVTWAKSLVIAGNVEGIVDRRARGSLSINALWKVVELAMRCTDQDVESRPTMSEAVTELEEAIKALGISASSNHIVLSHSVNSSISSMPCPR